MTTPTDPLALLRSRSYLALLVLAVIIGAPVSAAAYFFLALVTRLQGWIFTDLPKGLGFHGEPLWWPIPPLVLAGILVGLTIRYLPGTGGHSPADGFKVGEGPPSPTELPGIVLAALATLSLGVVLGPEAPLIALGGGLGVCAVRLVKRDAPARTRAVVASAGSFAAVSTLLGSPLLGAFLLMEASGLGGAMLELVLLPGLLAAGVGSLIFIGLDAWTGLGTFSLAIPHLPHVGSPTGAEFGWAVAIGVMAVPLGSGIRWLGLFLRPPMSSGGSCGPRRWSAWPLRAWRSRSPRAPGRAPRRCCSRGSPRSALSSATAPVTPWERCCCSWPARGSPTALR
jgi:H+/Cl- antiporter ClcA